MILHIPEYDFCDVLTYQDQCKYYDDQYLFNSACKFNGETEFASEIEMLLFQKK